MRKEDFIKLLDKYLDGRATPSERLLLEDYYTRLAAMEPVFDTRSVKKFHPGLAAAMEPANWSMLFENKLTMLKSCLKTAWRNLTKDKVYSFLNILGLSTGMAVALVIGLWVAYQYSYDRFLPGADRAYQVKYNYNSKNGTIDTRDEIAIPLAEAMKNDVPGIEHVALAFKSESFGPLSTVLSVGDKKLGPNGVAVGADFLKIFRYPLIAGNAENAMSDPKSIVLTESTAKALFGTTDIVGKTVRYNNEQNLMVTAVLKDFPANSSFRFDFLTSFADRASGGWIREASTRWGEEVFNLYVSLKPHVTYAQVEPQINGLIKKYAPDIYQNRQQEVIMQPLKDWHLYSVYKNGVAEDGLIGYVKLFLLIGVLVLVIACINFMNLSTARSEKRAKEVGIRKVVGSTRGWLILQFLTESVMVAFAAFILALFFVQLALPAFNTLAGTAIQIPYANPVFWLLMMSYILFTGLLAGSRPAFYLSSFKPLKVLKGKLQIGKSAENFGGAASPRSFLVRSLRVLSGPRLSRQILVVLQFSASIAFVIGTIIIYQQIQYARNRPRGYNSDQLVVTEGVSGNYFAMKQEALQSGMVSAMTVSFSPPTEVYGHGDVESWPGKQTNASVKVALNALGDTDYFKTLGISFAEGRNFTGEFANDSDGVIFNEAAIRQMQLKAPLNQSIGWSYETLPPHLRIIGVVHDALTSSPYAAAEPTAYVFRPWLFTITYRLASNVNPHTAMDKLRTIFTKYRPDFPFQYHFVDDSFAAKFALETLVGRLAGIFASLAIFISCLGLFGLAAYVAEQRTREIGIRKVLGASVKGVFFLVTKDFILLVVISCLIASSVAFYFLGSWLQGYYYHVSISPLVFVFADLGAIVLAVTTISFQAIKAALMNPVRALRTE